MTKKLLQTHLHRMDIKFRQLQFDAEAAKDMLHHAFNIPFEPGMTLQSVVQVACESQTKKSLNGHDPKALNPAKAADCDDLLSADPERGENQSDQGLDIEEMGDAALDEEDVELE